MRHFVLIVLLLVCTGVCAQVRKIFYDKEDQITKDSSKALSYSIIRKINDTTWRVDDYQPFVVLRKIAFASSSTYLDEKLKILNGVFTAYDVQWDGDRWVYFANTVGSYDHGKKTGEWIDYFTNGGIQKISAFKNGEMDGLYQTYQVRNKVNVEGFYINGLRTGDWYVIDRSGCVIITDTYEQGHVVNSVHAEQDSAHRYKTNGTTLIGAVIPTLKVDTAHTDIDCSLFMNDKMPDSIKETADGWMIVQFIINSSGKLVNPFIMRRLNARFDRAAVDVFSQIGGWRPAVRNNGAIGEVLYARIGIASKQIKVQYGPDPGELTDN